MPVPEIGAYLTKIHLLIVEMHEVSGSTVGSSKNARVMVRGPRSWVSLWLPLKTPPTYMGAPRLPIDLLHFGVAALW